MVLEFPDDPACDTLDRQYMLGDALLVAPVFSADGYVDYYLPHGRWTSFLSGELLQGGRWVREHHGYLSLPLMARPNAIVAVGANDQRPDYDFAEGVTFHAFELQDGFPAVTSVPTMEGAEALAFEARRKGREINIEVGGTPADWSVLLRGVQVVQSVEGGRSQAEALGVRLLPAAGENRLTVHL
jgi:alpha-D-xyloside xylohydrolase